MKHKNSILALNLASGADDWAFMCGLCRVFYLSRVRMERPDWFSRLGLQPFRNLNGSIWTHSNGQVGYYYARDIEFRLLQREDGMFCVYTKRTRNNWIKAYGSTADLAMESLFQIVQTFPLDNARMPLTPEDTGGYVWGDGYKAKTVLQPPPKTRRKRMRVCKGRPPEKE